MRRRTSADRALEAASLRFGNAHVWRRWLNWSRSTPAVCGSSSACGPAFREKLWQMRLCCGGHSGVCMRLRMMHCASRLGRARRPCGCCRSDGLVFAVVGPPNGGSGAGHRVDELWHGMPRYRLHAGTNSSDRMWLCFNSESAAAFCEALIRGNNSLLFNL
jgi:hypothetical protein